MSEWHSASIQLLIPDHKLAQNIVTFLFIYSGTIEKSQIHSDCLSIL